MTYRASFCKLINAGGFFCNHGGFSCTNGLTLTEITGWIFSKRPNQPKALQGCCFNRGLAPAALTLFYYFPHPNAWICVAIKEEGGLTKKKEKASLLKFQEAFSSFGVRCAMTCLVYIWNWG